MCNPYSEQADGQYEEQPTEYPYPVPFLFPSQSIKAEASYCVKANRYNNHNCE